MAGGLSLAGLDPRGSWAGLTRNQRISLVGVLGLAVIVIGFFVNLARTPDYAVAFSSLSDEDAAAIVAKLKEAKIPYEVAERGTIRVPRGQAEEVRLMMAAQGLPSKGSSVGLELFSQPHFGMTEFAEKINYQRALEGELSRTISRLDAVESARVHLVIPEPSLFTRNQKETTASVVVQLKPGQRLDAAQVQGITQLVANSVEGLKPQNVTVMDTSGAMLSDGQALTDPARQTGTRADVQRLLETRLASDVKTMLSQVIGPDKAVVRVNAELDWDQFESNSETYSPQQKAPQVRSQRQVSETTVGGGPVGGVPGTDSNVPTYPSVQAGGGQTQTERRDVTTNYELSKTVEKLVRAPGSIKRLSVAVALDSQVINDPAQADAISKLVATAAGLNPERGDVVTLTSMPFVASGGQAPAQVAEQARQREMLLTLLRLVALVVGPLLVALVIWIVLGRGRKPVVRAAIPARPAVEAGRQAPSKLPSEQRAAELPSAPEDSETSRIQKELTTLAQTDPAAVAQLIRTWMQEDHRPS